MTAVPALTDRLIDAQLHERLILYLTIYLVGDKIMVFIVDFGENNQILLINPSHLVRHGTMMAEVLISLFDPTGN